MKEHFITTKHGERRAFNPSICEFRGSLFMAYRVSYSGKPDGLRIATLDRETFDVLTDEPLDVPISGGHGAEDPRLFVHNESLHVAWTSADYSNRPWVASMYYGQIDVDSRRVVTAYNPDYGLNRAGMREKNWQFWSSEGRLFAQYSPSPQRVIELFGDTVVSEWITPGFEWRRGSPSGGTPPIRGANPDSLVSFFHSFVTDSKNVRTYSFGAMEFSKSEPFGIIGVSPKPILTAKETWPRSPDEWSPLCVFPGGAVRTDNGFLLSVGVNDAAMMIIEIPGEEILMTRPSETPVVATSIFRALTGFMLGGRVRPAGEVLEIDLAISNELLARGMVEHYNRKSKMINDPLAAFIADFSENEPIVFSWPNGSHYLLGIFDDSFVDSQTGETILDSTQPRITCVASDASEIPREATTTIRGVAYSVTQIQPDGTGLSVIQLARE